MRALTVAPRQPDSARLDDVDEPPLSDGAVLVRALAVGVCGTDREIIAGKHGAPPVGQQRLILGHESVGVVVEAPDDVGLAAGDLVAGIVRRPDPVPCASCAVGEWDMCRNGGFTERGIKERHGFCAERFRLEPEFTVKVDARLGELGVLLEPASVVAKVWDHIERIGRRSAFLPRRVLVTGAGPIGLLAALLGVQRGLDVHVLDRVQEGRKPEIVAALGATYHSAGIEEAGRCSDVVIECTGAPDVVLGAIAVARPCGIVCLTGLSAPGSALSVDVGALTREVVLENNVVFGSVNANRAHYEQAATALAAADPTWLRRLITRRAPLSRWQEAVSQQPDDVKNVIVFA